MYKSIFNKHNSLKFNRFSNKGYALFSVLGKEVLVGALSVATLSHAKAEGISTEGVKADSTLYKGGKAYELDAVNVTGSRAPMTVEQSPKIVSVITRDDIHRAAAQTINDVLKLATGVDVRQRGGFGVQTDISINGGTFDQITILLNGVHRRVTMLPTFLLPLPTSITSKCSRVLLLAFSEHQPSMAPSTS